MLWCCQTLQIAIIISANLARLCPSPKSRVFPKGYFHKSIVLSVWGNRLANLPTVIWKSRKLTHEIFLELETWILEEESSTKASELVWDVSKWVGKRVKAWVPRAGCRYWASRSLTHSFACIACSFACFAVAALLTCATTLLYFLTLSPTV